MTGKNKYSVCKAVGCLAKRMLFCSLIYCLTNIQLSAQRANFRFEHIAIEDGISDIRTPAILQDRHGFMWFGTFDGLNRFDGYEYTIYRSDPSDSTSLGENHIEELYEDSQGNIWIASQGPNIGLCRYNPQADAFVRYVHNPEDSTSIGLTAVSSIIETSDGYLWFGSWQGLDRLDLQTGIFKHFKHDPEDETSLSNSALYALYEDHSDNLWVGTGFFNHPSEGGLYLYHTETESFTRYQHDPNDPFSLRSNVVMSMFEDSRGNFWVGTQGDGLHLMDREKGVFKHLPYDPYNEQKLSGPYDGRMPSVNFVQEDQLGRLWIGGGGLLLFHPETESVVRFKTEAGNPESLSSYFIWEMTEDRFGNVWLGDGGTAFLSKVNLNPIIFQEYTTSASNPNSIRGRHLNALAPGEDGDLWIATSEGLNLYNPDREQLKFFKPTQGALYTIGKEGAHTLWYGGWETGLFQYNIRTKEEVHFPNLTRDDAFSKRSTITSLLLSRNNTLWVSVWSEGLYRYDRQSSTFLKCSNEEVFTIDCILEDRSGQLWAGGAQGLFQYNSERNELEKVLDAPVNSIFESHNGRFWLGTNNGLWLYDRADGQVAIFTTQNGLASNAVFHIAEDSTGALWLGTGKKISKFQPASKHFTNFDAQDGLLNEFNDFWSEDAVAYSSNGDIFFGGAKRLTRILTQEIQRIKAPPQITLTKLQTSEDTIRLLYQSIQNLEFSYDQNELVFEYVGLHYTNPAKNQYQYTLENFDKEWKFAGTDRKARYTNIPPGHYTFRVKAVSSEGVWSKEDAHLNVLIHPPWWKTWQAYLFYILTICLALYAVYHYQKRRWELQASLQMEQAESQRLKELDEFKSRFYANITHEFRTPLTVIEGLAAQIKENPHWKTGEQTDLITRNSRKLLGLINQMLDLSKLEAGKIEPAYIQGDIIKYLSYLTESFHSMALSRQITLSFHSHIESLTMDYDPEKCRQVLSNLLSNALKFTPVYGKINVVAKEIINENRRRLEVSVRDTGSGIPKEKLPFIFDRFYQVDNSNVRKAEGSGLGLALTKELLSLMGGSIKVESPAPGRGGKGSLFTFWLPIRKEAPLEAFNPSLQADEVAVLSLPLTKQPVKTVKTQNAPLVLIVEDNSDVIYYLRKCLEENYQIQEATNGREGVDKAIEHIPDLVISDVMMPEMDGFELCRILKTDERTNHIPIVLLTAKATQTDKIAGLTQGADAYLTKPFQKEELLIRIDKLIEGRRQLQQKYQSPQAKSQETEDPFLQKIRTIVESHLDDADFSVMQLSRALGMSRVQAHRKLKALTGLSTTQYIRNIRLDKAWGLLKNTDLTIAEIGYQVGFKDPSHFSRTFSQYFGRAPSEMRN